MDDTRPGRPRLAWIALGIAVVAAVAWIAGAYAAREHSGPAPPGLGTDAPAALAGEAEAFWLAVGSGDTGFVAAALDPDGGEPLRHYAGFATAFRAGWEPGSCREASAGTIRCTLEASNPALVDLYWPESGTSEYTTSASVTFTEAGVAAFELPGLINTAALRLFNHAGDRGEVPEACDRVHHDAADLPPFSTVMAQTEACAEVLVGLIPEVAAAG